MLQTWFDGEPVRIPDAHCDDPALGGLQHDAAVDEIYRQLVAKASKNLPSKSKKIERAQET